MTNSVVSFFRRILNWLRDLIPASRRELFYRIASGVSTLLLTIGLADQEKAALWGQLAIGLVATLFAALYATSNWRVIFYGLIGPLGGLLLAYGLVNNEQWALAVAAAGQLFGITTAAAKTVPSEPFYTYAVLPKYTDAAPPPPSV